jgi:hypothetical protein
MLEEHAQQKKKCPSTKAGQTCLHGNAKEKKEKEN